MEVISIVAVRTFLRMNTISCGVKVDKEDNIQGLSVGAFPYLEVGKIRIEKRRKRMASEEKNQTK